MSDRSAIAPGDPDGPFGALVRAIVFQQLAGRAAQAIYGRVRAAVGESLTPETLERSGRRCGRPRLVSFRSWFLCGRSAGYVGGVQVPTKLTLAVLFVVSGSV